MYVHTSAMSLYKQFFFLRVYVLELFRKCCELLECMSMNQSPQPENIHPHCKGMCSLRLATSINDPKCFKDRNYTRDVFSTVYVSSSEPCKIKPPPEVSGASNGSTTSPRR